MLKAKGCAGSVGVRERTKGAKTNHWNSKIG